MLPKVFNFFHSHLSLILEKFLAFVFSTTCHFCHTYKSHKKNFTSDSAAERYIKTVINNSIFQCEKIYNSSLFGLTVFPLRSNPFNSLVACLAMYLMKSSSSLPPSYFTGLFLEFLGAQ